MLALIGTYGLAVVLSVVVLRLIMRGNIVHLSDNRKTPPFAAGGWVLPSWTEPEPTYEATEAALFETLQAAEYRIPYQPPASWPLLECDHEWEEVHVLGQAEPVAAWCVICGSPGVHTHLKDGVPVDRYGAEWAT